jgi:hypothetical protein
LQEVKPPLPDSFLLIIENRGNSIIHLLQLIGYLGAGIRTDLFELL